MIIKKRTTKFLLLVTLVLFIPSLASCNKTPASETNMSVSHKSFSTTSSTGTSTSSVYAYTSAVITKPAPESTSKTTTEPSKQEDGYFNGCTFIGDSLTQGLEVYSFMDGAEILSHIGLNTSTALNNSYTLLGKRRTIASAVGEIQPKNIFILLGSNDVEWMPEKQFIRNYTKFVQKLKDASPKSVVYLQSIFPVTQDYEKKNPNSANKKIDEYNEDIRDIASQNNVSYLNVSSSFKDSTNALPDKLSDDGMHLRIAGYKRWCDYLQSNVIKG